MRTHELYKHINCLDVAIKPIKIWDVHKDYIKVKLWWYNVHGNRLGIKEPWSMNYQETVKIQKKDLSNWKLYETMEVKSAV